MGVTVNGITGEHVEAHRTQAIPFVPLPMFEIERSHKNVHIRAEIVPQIGPVPLAEGTSLIGTQQDPRLGYLDAAVLYAPGSGPFAFGFGETVINQRTYYPPSPIVQASRVVGARYDAEMTVMRASGSDLQARLALSPSLHGVQYTMLPPRYAANGAREVQDAERGSLVDASLRWRVPRGRFAMVYGLRFIDYSAAYSANGALADRNHVLMPFVGEEWMDPARATTFVPALAGTSPPREPRRRHADETAFAVTLDAPSGSMNVTPLSENVPRRFAIIPEFSLRHRHRRLEAYLDGVLPRRNTNLFGSPAYAWSYVRGGVAYELAGGRYTAGISDVAINQHFTETFYHGFLRRRASGVAYSLGARVFETPRERLDAIVRVSPYLHGVQYSTYLAPVFTAPCTVHPRVVPPPRCIPIGFRYQTQRTNRNVALLDATLQWTIPMRRYRLSYGLRYINQTTNDGAQGPGVFAAPLLVRNLSLMPFISVAVPLGR